MPLNEERRKFPEELKPLAERAAKAIAEREDAVRAYADGIREAHREYRTYLSVLSQGAPVSYATIRAWVGGESDDED